MRLPLRTCSGVVLAVVAGLPFAASAFQLSADAPASIVIAADADKGVRAVADELKVHLDSILDVKHAIVDDTGELPATAIVLGATRFTTDPLPTLDAFRLKADGGRLFVLGTRSGLCYGIYEFLERYCGCEWYTHDQSFIPRRTAIDVPDTLDDAQEPAFDVRSTSWHEFVRYPAFAMKHKVNAGAIWTEGPLFDLVRKPCRLTEHLGLCHTYRWMLPPDKYFDAHPEYFSFWNGKRLKERSHPCLTNPEVLEICWRFIEDALAKDPATTVVGVSQNDWNHWCECENCARVNAEEESPAGTQVRFVNEIARRLAKTHPGVRAQTVAYHYTKRPPKLTRLEPNVMLTFSTTECDYSRPLAANPRSGNVEALGYLRDWCAQSDRVHVWNYTTDFWAYPMPMPNVYSAAEDLKLFRSLGVFYVYEQGCRQGPHAWFGELKGWLYAHLLWNPDQPLEGLLRRFFTGYYGAAAERMRTYFDNAHKLTYDIESQPLNYSRRVVSDAFPNEFFEESARILSEAAKRVADDPVRRENVAWAVWANDYARVLRWLYDQPTREPERFAEMRELAKSVVARRRTAPDPGPVFAEHAFRDELHMGLLRELAESDGTARPYVPDPKVRELRR